MLQEVLGPRVTEILTGLELNVTYTKELVISYVPHVTVRIMKIVPN